MSIDDESRIQAVRRLWAKRGFKIHLTAFAIVSLAMLLIWATASGGDYFWPIWPIAGWGIGLAVHAWITFWPVVAFGGRDPARNDKKSGARTAARTTKHE